MNSTTTCVYGGIVDKDPGLGVAYDFSTSTCATVGDNATQTPLFTYETRPTTTLAVAEGTSTMQSTTAEVYMLYLVAFIVSLAVGVIAYNFVRMFFR